MYRLTALTLLLIVAPPTPAGEPAAIPPELTDYVRAADNSYSWKLSQTTTTDLGTVYTIDLISQTWHGVKWDHKLQVYLAKNAKPTAVIPLWNEGGTPGLEASLIGLKLSSMLRAPLAILFGVPKQPLYGGKVEDALIAETFVRFLTTEDPTWPLLFPMVKSVVRAMDTLQAFGRQEWNVEVTGFVVAGASKRGWTAWLTAATGDSRVKAIAPLVFDTLNLGPQMEYQVRCFGGPSEMIRDYAERLLLPIPRTAAARRLWAMIDPWSYRERITCPKLIVLGTNDEYWTLDALNLYWDGLKGDKWVLYVPNAGHQLVEKDRNGRKQSLPERAYSTLCAFCRAQVFDLPFPKMRCEMAPRPEAGCLDVNARCDTRPVAARLYLAEADGRDFRKAYWESQLLELDGTEAVCRVELPKSGNRATLLELEFQMDDLKFCLSAPLRICDPTGK